MSRRAMRIAWLALVTCAPVLAAQNAARPAIIALGAGADFTCALAARGQVFCWGRNDVGQLGRGSSDTLAHPEPRPVLLDVAAVSLGVGYDHACVTTADGSAFCWGGDRKLESGAGTRPERCVEMMRETPCRTRPVKVAGAPRFRYVAAGFRQSCGIAKDDGHVHCWGDALAGLHPRDSTSLERCGAAATADWCRRRPTVVSIAVGIKPDRTPASTAFDTLALGALGACGIAGGIIHCWGGGMGQASPWQGWTVPGGVGVRSVSVGFEHACGQREPTTIICWGERDLGALGIGADGANGIGLKRWMDKGSFISGFAKGPRVVGDRLFSAVSAGGFHTCAIEASSGGAFCWGENQWGQLGTGVADNATGRDLRITNREPRHVASDAHFTLIAAGVDHTCGVTQQGDVSCWGRTLRGATGGTYPPAQDTPKAVPVGR